MTERDAPGDPRRVELAAATFVPRGSELIRRRRRRESAAIATDTHAAPTPLVASLRESAQPPPAACRGESIAVPPSDLGPASGSGGQTDGAAMPFSRSASQFRALDSKVLAQAQSYLARGQEDGTVRADVDVPAQAMLALAVIRGITLQWMLDPAGMDLDRIYGELARWLERGLGVERRRKRRAARAG